MKKILNIWLKLAIIVFLLMVVIYANVGKEQESQKGATAAVQKVEKHDHEEGSAACQEKHAKGECKGHESGQSHHMEKCDNPGHGHKEGSTDCKDKHTKGECKGHQPGEKHSKPNK